MKKLIIVVLTISLIGTTPVYATSKAGLKCTKLNATTIVGSIKYTCIKSGNKLLWNKGVSIKTSNALKQGICPPKSVADKNPGISKVRAETLIGMNESDAENCANLLGWGFRVGQRDGEDFPMTLDFLVDRVTVTSVNGFITKVTIG